MKILEAQSAVLSNYEVYQFLDKQHKEYADQKRRGPGNLETLRRELLAYFRTPPGPLSQEPPKYHPKCIAELLEKLRPFDITKGEMIMIFNLRPTTVPILNTVIEDMEDRFDEDQQQAIVNSIIEVLGEFEAADAMDTGEDAMQSTE